MADAGVSFLIPAAGTGERLGLGPKGLLELRGRPLLCWLADKALQVAEDVIVAVPVADVDVVAALLPACRVIAGGATRHESVVQLVQAARGEWLLLHDATRPFASVALFETVLEAARATGCAGAFLEPDVPIARLREGRVVEAYARDEVGEFQSPQVFSRAKIDEVLARQAAAPGLYGQSTIQLALLAAVPVSAVPGEKTNIKITTAEDWRHAAVLEEYLR